MSKVKEQVINAAQKISWAPLILVSLASFVCGLDQTFMNVSMSNVVKDLNTTTDTVQTIMSFYTLITAALMILGAKLLDIYGRRRVFIIGSIIYGFGTTLAAISWNATTLFIGWALLEGIGGALMTPAVTSIITGTYEGEKRTSALAISSVIVGISCGIGPLFGGVVNMIPKLSWRVGFASELLVILIIVIWFKKIPKFSTNGTRKDLDMTGTIVSILALVTLVVGILRLDDDDTTKNYVSSGLIILGGIILLIIFAIIELRRVKKDKVPLFDVRLFKYRNLTIGTIIKLFCSIVMAGALFAVSVFLQSILNYSAIQTGLVLLPLTLGMLIASLMASRYVKWCGHKVSMIIGFVIAIAGCILLESKFTLTATYWDFAPGMFVLGLGIGVPLAICSDASLEGIGDDDQNACSGLLSMGQTLGMSMGTAIIGVIMLLGARIGLHSAIASENANINFDEAETYLMKLATNATSTSGKTREALAKVLQKGMGTVMIVCAALMLVTLLITFALKTKKNKTETVEENSATE